MKLTLAIILAAGITQYIILNREHHEPLRSMPPGFELVRCGDYYAARRTTPSKLVLDPYKDNVKRSSQADAIERAWDQYEYEQRPPQSKEFEDFNSRPWVVVTNEERRVRE